MIVLRTPQGLDRPEGGRRRARSRATGAPTRCRSPTPASNDPSHLAHPRGVDAQLPARGAVRRRRRGSSPELARARSRGRAPDERQPARQRRPAAARTCGCPTSATTPCRAGARAPAPSRRRACSATFLRDVMARNADRLPGVLARREQLQPPPGHPRGHRPRPGTPRPPDDDHLAPDGRVMEILSEHTCQGWLEGYLLTGRHGLFSCYEAFVHVVDSMFNQHAKWLKSTRRAPVAPPDRVAELPAHLARLAPGPQRLLATRTPASSTTS